MLRNNLGSLHMDITALGDIFCLQCTAAYGQNFDVFLSFIVILNKIQCITPFYTYMP